MPGYFDIHCHILPGVDDGAEDMEETRRMLLIAYTEGIRIIVATPHYYTEDRKHTINDIKAVYQEVQNIAAGALSDFHILLGNEILYSPDIIEALRRGEALTIDGTRYILVEFQVGSGYREIRDGLNHCIYSGYIPILAHAERYQCLNEHYELVGELIKLGVYIQLNISSIIRSPSHTRDKLCKRLMKNNWVHFLGTDAHGVSDRAPLAEKAADYIRRNYGEECVKRLLWENPMKMIEDRHLIEDEVYRHGAKKR